MALSILVTKFNIPPYATNSVIRTHLLDQITESFSMGHRLILISAPAGFGKTTLVSEWIANSGQPVAWLSLDERDNDPVRFLAYLIRSLQTRVPDLGSGLLELLESTESPPIDAVLIALINEISARRSAVVLVLDDYHLINSTQIDQALGFLIEHLPPQMQLLITTREDPALPLPRLRARNQMSELRAADLRFTLSEADEFLNKGVSLNLSPDEVAALEARTEGWVAGLQLAALSMKGRPDVSGFIQAFTGDHRYIVDYLVEEVLQRQPESVRDFLLYSSILDRLNGPLCDAVTGQDGGKARLESLQRGNFFLIPLDDKRYWYRYHHLFADVLRMHLTAEQADQVPVLHRRACEWYAKNGLPIDAIQHALAGEDFERAAALIELEVPAMNRNRQEATLLGWMKALPDELFRTRPVLSVHYVGALLSNGESENIEDHLRDAERWLDAVSDGPAQGQLLQAMTVLDETEFRRLPGSIAMYRAAQALMLGNVTDTMLYAQRVLDHASAEDHVLRGAGGALLGLAFWTSGDLETAFASYAEGMAHLYRAGNVADTVGGAIVLADLRIAQGHLHDAKRIYERGLQLAREHGSPTMRGTADMYVGMSELEREHNNLPAAMQYLLRSREQGEHTGFPQHSYRWRVTLARIHQAQGDLDSAQDLLDEAASRYVSDFSPDVRPIAAWKARVWIAQGRLGEALNWVRERGLSIDDDLSYLREFEHITLARILLARHQGDGAQGAVHEAITMLKRLLKAAEDGKRSGSVIEILTLLALAHHLQGDTSAAVSVLEPALKLAEPEAYIRLFVDTGAAMEGLLREAASQGIMADYTGRLLAAFESERTAGEFHRSSGLIPTGAPSLIEPLSQRELEILRLFDTELSGPEIAQELVIGLSTVRTHTKSIFSKLNVNNRRAAVRQAKGLNLI